MATPIIADYRRRYGDVANFVYIYISEAHAQDEWPLGNVESHPQPKTIEDRLILAQSFRDVYMTKAGQVEDIPVFVDGIENSFDEYAVWPERFYIIENNILVHIGEPCTELGFDRGKIEDYLENYTSKKDEN
jgi:hypothetical protein